MSPEKKPPPPTALARGAKLAARREHTAADLARKLRQKGHERGEVSAALTTLREKGYVDDERAAAAWVAERQRKGYGPRRVAADLARHGVSSEVARQAIAEHYPATREREILAGLIGRASAAQLKDPLKLAEKLLRRGFSADAVRNSLAGIEGEMGELLEFPEPE